MEEFNTPRRPKYRVSKPQHIRERTQPWTASRSQRLLRPLLSRIALLKRNIESSGALPTQASATELLQRKEAPTKRPADDAHPWLAPRKKLRRTYSQKCATSHPLQVPKLEKVKFKPAKDLHRDSCTGEVVAFTPLLRRVRGHHVSSPIQGPDTTQENGHTQRKCISASNANFGERLTSLRAQVSPARYADYEAIFRNTEALLIAVSNRTGNKGASSLMAMCLRKVPQYVAGIEAWEVHEAEKHGIRSSTTGFDVAPRIYAELESLGASDTGWVHLRSVVLADALDALADAVAEGLFPDEFTILLIELCFEYGVSQLGGLCEVFLARKYPEPLSSGSRFLEASISLPMSFLRDVSARYNRPSLLLQHLSSLLVQELLPHTWLGTSEFEDVWALAYRLLAKKQGALDAVDFLATSLALLCRYQSITSKQKQHSDTAGMLSFACQRTLTDALSILSAMRRLGHDEILAGNSFKLDQVARIGRSLGFIFHACIAEVESWKGRWGEPRDLICLATFLSSTESQGDRVNDVVTRAIDSVHSNQIGRTRQSHDTKIAVISGIAKICGRGTTQASRYHLTAICKQLGLLELRAEVLEDINRAGAFTLAQQSNDLRDLLYAEQLVSNSAGLEDRQVRASGKQTLFEGYRWDETISEWVTVSPILQKQVPKRRSLRSSTNDGASKRRISEHLANRAASCTELHGCTSLADQSEKQDLSTCKVLEAFDQTGASVGNGNFGTPKRSHRDTCSVTDIQTRADLLRKRRSWASVAEFNASHDELSNEKENCGQVMVRKRHSDGVRRPLATKRRIRFSGGNAHSDDELGM